MDGLISVRFKRCAFIIFKTGFGAHQFAFSLGTGGEADYFLSSSVSVKNAQGYTSTPAVCLHDIVLN